MDWLGLLFILSIGAGLVIHHKVQQAKEKRQRPNQVYAPDYWRTHYYPTGNAAWGKCLQCHLPWYDLPFIECKDTKVTI